jgi:hypothetical protein
VAAFLEETTPEIRAAASALAHHWREAGENARAADYFVIAGDQAGRGWARHEAAAFYQEALALLPEEQAAQRREILQRRAVALASVFHATELRRGVRRGRVGLD